MPVSFVSSRRHARNCSINSAERRFAGQVGASVAEHGGDLRADLAIFFHAKNHPLAIARRREALRGLRETLRQPALRRAIFRAGADADARGRAGLRERRLEKSFRCRDVRADRFGDLQIVKHLMAWRPCLFFAFFRVGKLVQKFVAPLRTIADPARDSREPDLECGTDGIWKQNRRVEIFRGDFSRDAPRPLAFFNRDDFVHLRHSFPEIDELRARENRNVRVGPAALDGADCRHAHHRVAEPVRRADQDAERLQARCWKIVRQHDAALVGREQKFRRGRFPALVNPKPILRRDADLLLQSFIDRRRELIGISIDCKDRLANNEAPARDADSVNCGR